MRQVHDVLGAVDLNLLVALEALLEEQHVTRAARRIGLTQSAASHALSRLRVLFEDPLLVRGQGGRLVPTPRAVDLMAAVRRILADVRATLRPEGFDPRTSRRTFRIGASDYPELVLLPRLIARIAELAPHVTTWVHAFAGAGDAELTSGALDVVIGPRQAGARPAGTYERALFDERFTCVLRDGHPFAKRRLTLERYVALRHLLVAPRGTPGSLVDDALAKAGQTRQIGLAVPHFLVVPHIVAATDFVATLARRVVSIFAESLRLVTRPPPVEIPAFTMALAWHERDHRDPGHAWLRARMFEAAAEVK